MRKRFFVGILAINLLVGCQANYIRDVQGGTVAPSSSSKLTGSLFSRKDQRIFLRSFFSARNLLPVNEKTAWGGGLIEG
uniref:colicin release lysis protein n=1 Tax=Escherichia coli TaxID=562 RepID=UPI002363A16F|nr:colicin release lysis protein [Escherichia coli]